MLEGIQKVVYFCDGGLERRHPHPMSGALVAAVRNAVALAQGSTGLRLPLAALLRRRVGDVFGEADTAYWRGLERERTLIRQWIATQLLDVIFTHLVPTGAEQSQTAARRAFWVRYTSSVERLWLLLDRRLTARVNSPAMVALLQQVGDVVEVRGLVGQVEQGVLWMQLRSESGGIVSVVEGNANTSVRIRAGAHAPRTGNVDYSAHIVNGAFSSQANRRPHQGAWERRVIEDLAALGVYPT